MFLSSVGAGGQDDIYDEWKELHHKGWLVLRQNHVPGLCFGWLRALRGLRENSVAKIHGPCDRAICCGNIRPKAYVHFELRGSI